MAIGAESHDYERAELSPPERPYLVGIEGGADATEAEEDAEPPIIKQTLLPLVEIQGVNQRQRIINLLWEVDSLPEAISEEELAAKSIYLWYINKEGLGQGVHYRRDLGGGLSEDVRVYAHWDKDKNFRRVRLHRWINGGELPIRQTFWMTAKDQRQPAPELVAAVDYLYAQTPAGV